MTPLKQLILLMVTLPLALQSQNVGIATTNPLYRLDVDAITGTTGNPVRLLGLLAGSTSDSIISSNAGILRRLSINQIVNANAWSTTGNSGLSSSTNFLGNTDAIDLGFRTNNTERMRILSGGNVGIGTSAPNTLMDINGAISLRPAATVFLTTNNQNVTVGNASFLIFSSDASAGSRAVVLSNGLQTGQILIINVILNGARIADIGNCIIAGNFDIGVNDTIMLIWNGSAWYEISRSNN